VSQEKKIEVFTTLKQRLL